MPTTRLSPTPATSQKSPRKQPSQSRAMATVEAIVEAAAHILETHGFAKYNTNAIAERAGVSIGSLYQYFPNKDSITQALIERETRALVEAVTATAVSNNWRAAIVSLIRIAVDHQLRRPNLARMIDVEERRIGCPASDFDTGRALQEILRPFLVCVPLGPDDDLDELLGDILVITRALTDAAGDRHEDNRERLERRVRRAVFGYLDV
jgi:AcrR family transcriptional regulator